ncbi:hypothetical protein [Sphingomonas sp.]|uniref:hypothetical protein n=1 Tax=Sphingomonas sp. TaxID=28214 RepID=UPI003BA91520
MARGNARRDLFLQVSGTVDPLKNALKGGSSALVEFAGNAEKQLEAVEQSLRQLGRDPAASAKQLTQNYTNAFREIRANAQQVLGADSGSDAMAVLNANASRQAAAAAEQRAAAIRIVADAARAEALAQGNTNTQVTQYAAAAMVAAREAEDYAIALREQANTLTAVEGRMDSVVAPGKRIVEVTGQARAGMQQLSYQLGDVATQLAAGTPPSIVFAQQIGQVTQAIGLMTNSTKGFVGFIGGPWGIAISSALVLLTPLVAKLWEKSDADKEAEKATKDHAKAIDALIEAQDRAVQSTAEKIRQDLIDIGQQREATIATRERTAALIEQAKAQLAAAKSAPSGGGGDGQTGAAAGRAALIAARESELAKLEAQQADNSAAIERLTKALDRAQARIVAERVKARSTPEGRVNTRFDELEKQARLEAERSRDWTKYARTLAQLDSERQKELKQLQENNRKAKGGASSTPSEERATPKQVGDLLKTAFGGTVTSTTGGKHVPGSYHYKGQAVDFVPAGGMGSVSKAQVRTTLEAQGVQIKELLGPGDKGHSNHFHVAFAKTRKSREAIERQQETLRQRELAEDISFVDEMRAARGRLLDAQGKTAVTQEERARLLVEEIDAEATARARKIGLQLSAGKLEEAEAAQLLEVNEQTRQARRAAIAREQIAAHAEKQLADLRDEVQRSDDLLRSQLQIADTQEDRARIERQLLENSYRIEMNEAAIEIATAFAAKDWDRYAKAIARAADLAQRKANDEEGLKRQNEGAFDRYQRELNSIDNINNQIDNIKIDTVRKLGDELAGAATKALGLKGALGEVVAALIRVGIERQIAGFLFGGPGSTGGGLFGSIGKLFGFADGGRPDRAANGRISGPGTGRSDSILALLNGRDPILVSNGESIVNAEATRKYWPVIDAMNKGTLPRFASGGLPSGLPSSLPRSIARLPDLSRLSANDRAAVVHQHHWQVNAQGAILAQGLLDELQRVGVAATIGGARLAQQQFAEQSSTALS